jgi:hypothetical protein
MNTECQWGKLKAWGVRPAATKGTKGTKRTSFAQTRYEGQADGADSERFVGDVCEKPKKAFLTEKLKTGKWTQYGKRWGSNAEEAKSRFQI